MHIISQRASGDCGIAALATFLGVAYEDVYVEASKLDRWVRGKKGLTLHDIITLARKLGVPLVRKHRPDLDQDEGVLNVRWHGRGPYSGHLTVLYNGMIIDPSGPLILPHEEWFAQHPLGTPGHLLSRI